MQGIGVRFGGLVALEGVSLHVPPGAVVGVIGPNGAGKTTLFNVACGFVKPQAGVITLDGRQLRPRPYGLAKLGIARTLQGIGLFAGLTVLENVMVGAGPISKVGFWGGVFGTPRSDNDEKRLRAAAMDRLDEMGVARYAPAFPQMLPYAVQKRVAMARALVMQPRLMLLDEPAGGLGHEDINELGELIRALPTREEGACSVMLVEHHMDLVMEVCDQIVVLDFGRVIATGTPDEVRNNPKVTEAYLGADASEVEAPAVPDIGLGRHAKGEPA